MDNIKLASAKKILSFDAGNRDWIFIQKTPDAFVGREKAIATADEWLRRKKTTQLQRYLWIYGALGTGKSAFAINMFKHIKDEEIGDVDIFFCEASTDNTRYANDVIKFIASYLCRVCGDEYFSDENLDFVLSEAFKSSPSANMFAKLIFLPTARICRSKKIYIIIDALDEMMTSECSILLDLFTRYNPPEWLKIIFTSREEMSIRTKFKGCSEKISLNDDNQNKSDIAEYLNRVLNLDDKYLSILAEKSAGNFLYAKYVSDYILTYGDVDLETLPEGLYALYAKMLDRKYDGGFDEEARGIFEILVSIKSPIEIIELAAILGISVADLNRYMQTVSSFVKSDGQGNEVKIYNPSFINYLTSPIDNPYFIDRNKGEKRLLEFIANRNDVLLESKYFRQHGLAHIVETKSSDLLSEIIQSPYEMIADKIENDLFYVYLTNARDVIATFNSIDIKVMRRILISTYRKGLSHGINLSDTDNMADIIELLRRNGEEIRATMLEGERFQRMGDYDSAEEKFQTCLELAKENDREKNTSWSRRYIALTYNRLGNLANKSGRGNAVHYYDEGYKLFKEIVDMHDEEAEVNYWIYIKDLAIATARIGDLKMQCENIDVDELISYYTEYNNYCKELVSSGQNPIGYCRELANSFRRMGDAYMLRDAVVAYNMYIRALRNMQIIVNSGATNTCEKLDENNLAELPEDNTASKVVRKKEVLPYENREPDYLREHALCFLRLSVAAYYLKKYELALNWANLAISTCSTLHKTRATSEAKNDLDIASHWKEIIEKEII